MHNIQIWAYYGPVALGMSVRNHPPVRLGAAVCNQSNGAVRGP